MDVSLLLPLLILLLLVPIFLSSRRQRRQVQEMQKLQKSLVPGDTVMTTSGLRATVLSVDGEGTVDLEIAPGVHTTWVRAAIREKVEPVLALGRDRAADGESYLQGPGEALHGPGEAGGARATGT